MNKNDNVLEEEEYVDVIKDYSYHYSGHNKRIYRNERYMVLRKEPIWWQVVNQDGKSLWAPQEYLRTVKLTTQEKKDSLRAIYKKSPRMARLPATTQKTESYSRVSSPPPPITSSQPSFRRDGSKRKVTTVAKQDISNPTLIAYHHPHALIDDPHKNKRQQKLTKEDISSPTLISHSRIINNNNEQQKQQPQQRVSSFKPHSVAHLNIGLHDNTTNNNNQYSSKNNGSTSLSPPLQSAVTGGSNKSSRLSLYDAGGCIAEAASQLTQDRETRAGIRGIKSNSYDGLTTERSDAGIGESYGTVCEKASSAEELDNRRTADHFFNNQLSYRNRSNSVDFKTLSKEHLGVDGRTEFYDKIRGGYPSKSRSLWRRSLVLEEDHQLLKQHRPAFVKGGDDLDVSLLLDMPPQLPPKQKSRLCVANGGLVDNRLRDIGNNNLRRYSHEFELTVNNDSSSYNKQPQLQPRDFDNSSYSNTSISQSYLFTSNSSNSSIKNTNSRDKSSATASRDDNRPFDSQHVVSSTDPQRTSPSTEASCTRRDPPVAKPRTMYPPPQPAGHMARSYTCFGAFTKADDQAEEDIVKKDNIELKRSFKEKSGGSVRKGSIRSFLSKKDVKSHEPLSSSSPETSKNKKLPKAPPSPESLHQPLRDLGEGWGEYWYESMECLFYYNTRTREKRWKPPRKMKAMEASSHRVGEFIRGSDAGSSIRSSHAVPHVDTMLTHPARGPLHHHKPLSMSTSVCSFLSNQPPSSIESVSSSSGSSGHLYQLDAKSSSVLPGRPNAEGNCCNAAACASNQSSLSNVSSGVSNGGLPQLDNIARSRQPLQPSSSPSCQRVNPSATSSHSPLATTGNNGSPTTSSGLSRQSPTIAITKAIVTPTSPRIQLPPRPPNSAKPTLDASSMPGTPDTPNTPEEQQYLFLSADEERSEALRVALQAYQHPSGWRPRSSLSRQLYENMLTGEKWVAASTDEGKIYFYNQHTNESLWQLPSIPKSALVRSGSAYDSEGEDGLLSLTGLDAVSPPPPPSPITPTQEHPQLEVGVEQLKEGFLQRGYYLKEGKRIRKNWSPVYVRYYARTVGSFPSGSLSLLVFAKGPDDVKINQHKCDMFDLFPPCELEYDFDNNKSSQNNVVSLLNGHKSQVLLRSNDRVTIDDWFKELCKDSSVSVPGDDDAYLEDPRKDERKSRKSGPDKTDSSVEKLSVEHRGIRDKLISFIKRRPTADTLVRKGIYQDAVFGNSISELCSQEKMMIPLFVLRCINAIERTEDNLKTDGLYRISGNAAQIQKIRFEVAKSNYQILQEEKDVNNLTGALKLFFRELKEPLLPFSTYDTFVAWSQSRLDEERKCKLLSEALRLLPSENFQTLKVLLLHLIRVVDYQADNRMNFMNLAIVFGPCLLWPENSSGRDLLTEAMVHNTVVDGLLSNFHKCVEEVG